MALPKAGSSGSLASISLFLRDNVAINNWVIGGNREMQKVGDAWMFKILHGLSIYLLQSEEVSDFKRALVRFVRFKNLLNLKKLMASFVINKP
ncbi:MAG: hypothetical protein ACK41T_04425 [Pseudobdellovibrio sp.]